MSCFKKDGTLKKIYAKIVPLLLNAAPHHATIMIDKNEIVKEYDCYEYHTDDRREKKYLDLFLEETGIKHKKMYSLYTCYYHIFDIDEVKKYC